jgi:hypothetical protein
MSRGALVVAVGLVCRLLAAPDAATAQVFIASQPRPELTIGPLFVRASVGPAPGPVDVTVLFSVVATGAAGSDALVEDVFLLWPGEVDGESVPGAPDPELRRTVEARGFQVTREGRLPLSARAVHHEVEIELDGDRVRHVQAQVHRSRLTQPGPP